MAPTTLITFMVRTPPTTRSVSLYGSWDNFTQAYALQRDTRLGPEHWSGCHNLSNIVHDGDGDEPDFQPRDGEPHMGGTYWYYYKLDDDLNFYNSAEPMTTLCPLRPGQLVNVLQVPYALGGSRSRNASTSSTSSERRTLEPADKFLHPRRPVPRPKLERLQTSPTTMSNGGWMANAPSSSTTASAVTIRGGWSAATVKSSAPSSAATLRMPSLSRKASYESSRGIPSRSQSCNPSRSQSSNPSRSQSQNPSRNPSPNRTLASGVALAFGTLSDSRSTSESDDADDADEDTVAERAEGEGRSRWRRDRSYDRAGSDVRLRPHNSGSQSLQPSRSQSQSRSGLKAEAKAKKEHDLLFRRRPVSGGSMHSVTFSSFAEHRRQRSRSRDSRTQSARSGSVRSSARNSLGLNDLGAEGPDEAAERRKQLSTVREAASAQNTPGFAMSMSMNRAYQGARGTVHVNEDRATEAVNLGKRLPTLPNSPSSAYPASATESEAESDAGLALQQSHFSSTTIDTDAMSDIAQSAQSTEFSESLASGTTQSSWLSRDDQTDGGGGDDDDDDDDGYDHHDHYRDYNYSGQPNVARSNRHEAGSTTPKTGRTENETEIEDTPQTSSTSSTFPHSTAAAITSGGLAAAVQAHYQDYRQYYRLPDESRLEEMQRAAAQDQLLSASESEPELSPDMVRGSHDGGHYQVPTFQQFMHQNRLQPDSRSRSQGIPSPSQARAGRSGRQAEYYDHDDEQESYGSGQQRPLQSRRRASTSAPGGGGHSSTMKELLDELDEMDSTVYR